MEGRGRSVGSESKEQLAIVGMREESKVRLEDDDREMKRRERGKRGDGGERRKVENSGVWDKF